MIIAKRIRSADGRARAQHDADAALPWRERAAGHRDDDGVVARQQQIDPDDLEDREQSCVMSCSHAFGPSVQAGMRRACVAFSRAPRRQPCRRSIGVGLAAEIAGAQLRLAASTRSIAAYDRRARLPSRRDARASSRPTRSAPIGLAMPWPAMSGAEPCTGSNSDGKFALRIDVAGRRDADGAGAGRAEIGQDVAEQVRGDDHVEPVRDAARNAR